MKKGYVSYAFTAIFFIVSMIFIFNYKQTYFGLVFGLIQFAFFFFLMFFISGQWLRSLNFASIVMFILFMINRLSLYFYRKTLFANDFLVYFNYENWDILTDFKEIFLAVFAMLIMIGFGVFAYSRHKRSNFKFRLTGLFIAIALVLINTKLANTDSVKNAWIKTFPELKATYMNLSMTIGDSASLKYNSPSFANSYQLFQDKLNLISDYNGSNLKPNLVLWLQESTIDASFYKGELAQPDMFKGDFKFKTLNRVHTFGGRTWKSEFEVLTGLSPDEFNENSSLIFQYAAPHIKYSLPKILKEQGYYTIALNPYPGSAYNSKNAYKNFGIDEYVHPSELQCEGAGNKIKKLKHITSLQMGKCAQKVFEKYKDKQPLFIYMLTINEHAPYDRADKIEFNLDKFYKKPQALKLTDYYKRQLELSKATTDFDSFMQSTDRPYIFAYFGDHQGNMGLSENDVRLNFNDPLVITGFYVKGSPDIESIKSDFNELGELSLMPSVLLELMQIRPNEFFKAHYAMRKICGNVDDCKDKELVKSYKSYLYDYLKDASENLENK
ncbi:MULTISPECIES: sulfatase-like hydrolase/transferase [Campylobacter]|uniref:Phosphoglycerol transferase n=1 Tax=Campylobacter curvus (strain 525.92) TaxID=360105 RepID=A7GYU2_CAMC5|nr:MULTISPECIES: sulfatase-like hydrolase/transferase [Campylobacter]EAT99947.1 phosphoglycerol transferase [Campylobacter curvus 525.92]EJP74263.1 arylsulfatase domain protein [Campylobacter sp. FOBRC14]